MSHATENSSNTATAAAGAAAAAPRTRNQKTFHGRGLELNNHFKEWWKEARKSEEPPTPYEFLTNFGLNVDNHRWDVVPKMIWSTIVSLIPGNNFHPGPGVLDYFVHYLKDGLEKHPGADNYNGEGRFPKRPIEKALIHGAGEDGVTEQDIKSLIQYIPPKRVDIQICINHGYSSELIDCFFEKCLEPQIDLYLYEGSLIDETLMSIIQKHIGRIKRLVLDSEYEWTKGAFAQCLSTMLQSISPKEWELVVPNAFVGNSNDQSLINLSGQEAGSCINSLTIYFSHINEASNQQVMEILHHMIGLKVLHLCPGSSLMNNTPDLVQYLQTATVLTHVSIDSRQLSNTPATHELLDMLGALKSNSSILRYKYIGVDRSEMEFCESQLLGILKEHNTTLKQVELRIGKRRSMVHNAVFGEGKRFKSTSWDRIDYYLMLNKCGRGRARDPELGLLDLLSILGLANHSLLEEQIWGEPGDGTSTQTLNILFGLLREQPVMWSVAHSHTDISEERRKRKHQNQQEGSQRKQQKEN